MTRCAKNQRLVTLCRRSNAEAGKGQKLCTCETTDAQCMYRKNHARPCQVCGAKPTVGDLALCGPCCWGEAATAGGNW